MATGLEPTAKGQSKGWRRLITEQVGSYELCLSFTRNGLARRVPWVFVLYATGAEKGTRSTYFMRTTHKGIAECMSSQCEP